MSKQITINNITGSTPFDIYVCDEPITLCIYIDTVSVFPYSFMVPLVWETLTSFNVKVIDDNNCESILTLNL